MEPLRGTLRAPGREASAPSAGDGQERALRLLQAAAGPRLVMMHALIVVVLLATAQTYDGSRHGASHWPILAAYATASIGLGLTEQWERSGSRARAGFASRHAEELAWAATLLNASVAVYIEVEHLLVGSVGGFDNASDTVSRLPAFLLLLQTGMSMRVRHTAVFAAVVTLVWSVTIGLAALGAEGSVLGPHVSLREEVPGLLGFVVASLVVIDGVRRLRAALATALRLEHERTLLARFVPEGVADKLAREGDLGTVRERHACLFLLDIRGFSALSRNEPSETVVRALLDVRALTHGAVVEHDGLVDKYVGDGVLAHFLTGTPRAQVRGALGAALATRDRLEGLNAARAAAGLPPLAITIALHAGTVLAGVFDDGQRAEFTALGPTMNTLARLEARAKAADVTLAVSEDVLRLLDAPLPGNLRAVGCEARGAGDGPRPALFAIEPGEAAAVA